jgi:hypothetical protein
MGWETRIDRNRNYYLMRLWGLMTDDECRAVAARVLAEIPHQMKPGFTLISDISELKPLTKEGTVIVRDSGAAVAKMGVKHTIRIVGASAVAAMQFKRETKTAYEANIVASLAEAEALLDRLEGRTK